MSVQGIKQQLVDQIYSINSRKGASLAEGLQRAVSSCLYRGIGFTTSGSGFELQALRARFLTTFKQHGVQSQEANQAFALFQKAFTDRAPALSLRDQVGLMSSPLTDSSTSKEQEKALRAFINAKLSLGPSVGYRAMQLAGATALTLGSVYAVYTWLSLQKAELPLKKVEEPVLFLPGIRDPECDLDPSCLKEKVFFERAFVWVHYSRMPRQSRPERTPLPLAHSLPSSSFATDNFFNKAISSFLPYNPAVLAIQVLTNLCGLWLANVRPRLW